MTVLPIITGENTPVLRTKTKKVEGATKKVLRFIKDMHDSVQAANGVGLAAPQVGVSDRICLAQIQNKMTPLINPKIIWKSQETDIDTEGCLSLPKIEVKVPRSLEIVLRYVDEKNTEQERKLQGFDARVVQHEVDHLEGMLIVDYKKGEKVSAKDHATSL